MTRIYKTMNSEFHVNPVEKTVKRIHYGDRPRWHDDVEIGYEFMERIGEGLYFHAIDPDTGGLRPFYTSEILEVI